MKRQNQKNAGLIAATNERRKLVQATLVGSALISPKSGAKAMTAVLDNINRIGVGLSTKEKLAVALPVSVSLAFLDSKRVEQMERLDGTVAWAKPWRKGFLIGVAWDGLVTKEKNRWLCTYLEERIRSSS